MSCRCRRVSFTLLALAACASGPAPNAGLDIDAARAKALVERALEDNQAIATLQSLIAAAPKRLCGSPGAADAVQWGLATMRSIGLENVRAEPVTVPHWQRGEETATAMCTLGRTELKSFTTWNDGRPETELNFKFYRQATNKIVGLAKPTATFLEKHF